MDPSDCDCDWPTAARQPGLISFSTGWWIDSSWSWVCIIISSDRHVTFCRARFRYKPTQRFIVLIANARRDAVWEFHLAWQFIFNSFGLFPFRTSSSSFFLISETKHSVRYFFYKHHRYGLLTFKSLIKAFILFLFPTKKTTSVTRDY